MPSPTKLALVADGHCSELFFKYANANLFDLAICEEVLNCYVDGIHLTDDGIHIVSWIVDCVGSAKQIEPKPLEFAQLTDGFEMKRTGRGKGSRTLKPC